MKKLTTFSSSDLRWDFYPLFINLMKKSYEIEAFILMLATWNSSRFRFAMNKFDLYAFREEMRKLKPLFDKMQQEDFKTIDFNKYRYEINKIFGALSGIKGIESTGATKLMHLKLPKIFVMWDKRIRERYGYMLGDADDYFLFLINMQKRFSRLKVKSDRTLAKLIDENNYIKITMPALRKKKNRKDE